MYFNKNNKELAIKDLFPIICFFVITVVGLYLRYLPYDFISRDMNRFLIPWFQIIKDNGGFVALNQQVGDYGLLYQTIIAAFSYAEVNPVYLYKALSIFFDFLLAGSVAYFIRKSDTGKSCCNEIKRRVCISCAIYASILFLPTVVMNSAFWGQCDSIYTFFLLWSLWFLYKERYSLSFLMLGCSLAFKLQGILLMPLFLFFCFYKKFSAFNFLITVFTFWLSGIISYIHGRGLLDGFAVYVFQVGEFRRMWINVPSIWFFFEENYEKYHIIAICLTFLILSIVLLMLLRSNIVITTFTHITAFALFIEWTCIIFLPAMHERYTYVMDILALFLAFSDKRFIKYALIAVGTSCITYNTYLFAGSNITFFNVLYYLLFFILYIIAWLHFTSYFCLGLHNNRNNKDKRTGEI